MMHSRNVSRSGRMLCLMLALGAGGLAGCQGGGVNEDGTPRPMNRPIPAIMESGENAMRARDYEKARLDFSEAVEKAPGNANSRYWLGKALLAQGKPAEAREHLEVALAADVENHDIYAGLCQALYEDGKLDELFRLLRQRATEHGTVADFATLGDYSRKAGDPDEAHTALLTAARLDQGRSVAPQLALADFYDSINNKTEASRRLRMAYFIDSTNPKVNDRLVKFGHRLGPGLGLRPLERP